MKISAEVIADSLNSSGDRCTSLVLSFPRFILAELNTHRAFSRNSASSRAVPFEKMLKRVQEDPFIPIAWMKDHKGMQGDSYLDKDNEEICLMRWLTARDNAVESAKEMSYYGLTKQIVNRLLEPFMWHTAIVTATDFENFFALRANDAAEIHFKELAFNILEAMRESKPKVLKDDEWHIPFGDNFREDDIILMASGSEDVNEYKLMIATARCARVSYINFEGKDDYYADIDLFKNLLKQGHMSPFEHCAKASENSNYYGNFKGFMQLRKTITGESKSYKI